MKAYNKHLVVLGSARSGTSWFSELIALQHRYRMLFEPEHEFNTAKGKLICDRFITEKTKTNNIDNYLKKVFSNQVDCDWIAQISNRKWKRHLWPIIPKKFIIKFVRCNLSAHYMANQFNIPVVFIVRNPYDVIASQQRVKFPWLYDLSWFKSQDVLCDLIWEHFNFNLKQQNDLSAHEKLCIRWCIENSIPLLRYKSDEAFELIKYEDVNNNIDFFLEFCKRYDLKPLITIETAFKNPSSKTHPKSEIRTGNRASSKLNAKECEQLNTYLDIFKINLYEREY
ncbi:sulfotransferase family protein [Winogradskyella psychrotolerans]|uniref:sulfotransferase family protein n=1 Tax=Winogradskyella psychrotolerans TaxID=1344585 RepID=UPI001C0699C7|nr:sulfotransferase family protein [Winogradskyella psychrotolerans]MBU2929548.1 sulfotransferase family protein [Winogradskyella psychrotolerans]